jgi:hypothetical protein
MDLLHHVGTLWHDPKEGLTFSGTVTLPQPLPAGLSLRVVAVPQPLRGRKEKWQLHVGIPLPEPPAPSGPDDLIIQGELMSQFFRPPRPPGKRYKIMLWGESGTAKSKSALEFPQCAYLDNHGSVEPYEADYPENRFAHPVGPDDTMAAITSLLRDPGDRLSAVMDDGTTYWDQVQAKWADLFLKRLPRSKGHHAEFYTLQPSDWIHPKREMKALIQRLIALDLNVVIVARAKKEYAGAGDDFMKVIGEIFAGEKNLIYEFDYIFNLRQEEGKRLAVVNKQRVPAGGKPFPEKFEFEIDAQGRSTFFQVFQKFALPQHFTTPPNQVADPVKDVIPAQEEPEAPESPGEAPAPVAEPPDEKPRSFTDYQQPINTKQLDELKRLKDFYKIGNEEWGKTILKLYNVKTAKALTEDQASNFINYLQNQRAPF